MIDFQKEVSQALGKEHVFFGDEIGENEIKNTLNVKVKIAGVLYPTTKENVIEIVRLANKHLVKIYPVSLGKNWGYGCQTPTHDDCYIVNLSKLHKIEIINKELGVFSIEPGVTQKMMYEFLLEHQLNFMIPTTGAGLNCSLIGNALDRGYGLSPITDHFKGLTSIDAVLANGEQYHSPFLAYGCETLSHLHPNGVGLNIQALFAQSNLGIVTRASIHLQKKSTDSMVFYFGTQNSLQLAIWVELIQIIMSEFIGTIYSVVLMNKNRVQATVEQNTVKTHQSENIFLDKIIFKFDQMEWVLGGAIYGDDETQKIVIKKLKKMFSSKTDLMAFISQKKLRVLKSILTHTPIIKKNEKLFRSINNIQSMINLIYGTPSNSGLNLAYLYKKYNPNNVLNLNPSIDDVGLIWFAPLVPIIREKVLEYNEIITRVSFEFETPLLITFNTISSLCFDCTIPIFFNKNDEQSAIKARRYFWALLTECQKAGFFPYRLDIEAQKKLITNDVPYWNTAISIKKALDPNNIMSPGRYLPPVT